MDDTGAGLPVVVKASRNPGGPDPRHRDLEARDLGAGRADRRVRAGVIRALDDLVLEGRTPAQTPARVLYVLNGVCTGAADEPVQAIPGDCVFEPPGAPQRTWRLSRDCTLVEIDIATDLAGARFGLVHAAERGYETDAARAWIACRDLGTTDASRGHVDARLARCTSAPPAQERHRRLARFELHFVLQGIYRLAPGSAGETVLIPGDCATLAPTTHLARTPDCEVLEVSIL